MAIYLLFCFLISFDLGILHNAVCKSDVFGSKANCNECHKLHTLILLSCDVFNCPE